MASKRPTTIPEYIRAAPRQGQPHLRRLYAILKSVAPEAEEAIKWGTPFFVEPRFLFAFSAHTAHLNFAPKAVGLEPFRKELEQHKTTKGLLQIPYNKSLPEDLVRKIAEYRLRDVREREDDAFWELDPTTPVSFRSHSEVLPRFPGRLRPNVRGSRRDADR
jgi:uncharacterized protein YdhG (YjbR/CyaY superfamily)